MNIRAILSIIKDTFRETMASWVFYLIFAFSTLLGVAVLGLGVRQLPEEHSMQKIELSFPFLGKGEVPGVTVEQFQNEVMFGLANYMVGFFGVLIAVILTASFVPRMFRKGTIELYLSRSVRRWEILIAKYLGGLTFVAFHAAYLITLLFLAFGVRSGIWNFRFLWAVPILTFLFGVLYAFSVLVGITWKNTIPAIFLTICLWGMCSMLSTARDGVSEYLYLLKRGDKANQQMVDSAGDTLSEARKQEIVDAKIWLDKVKLADSLMKTANYILPPTSELSKISKAMFSGKYTEKTNRPPPPPDNSLALEQKQFKQRGTRGEPEEVAIPILHPLLTCCWFVLLCLGLSTFRFYRQEF